MNVKGTGIPAQIEGYLENIKNKENVQQSSNALQDALRQILVTFQSEEHKKR
jgi:hypothetical protein